MSDSLIPAGDTKAYIRDLVERVVTTFVVAGAGVVVAAGPAGLVDVSMWKAAAIAGLAAVGSLIKGLAAKTVGNPHSASLTRS